MKKSTVFRKMLSESGVIVMPGAYDALSAKIIELVGFKAIQHTGYGTAASLLGMPDIGLVSFKEMVDRVASIARAVNIPVIGDADTGYGNPINAYRTVKEYIWAGAAGLFIEDQVWPKRCGHMFGKMIIDKEEMMGKIMAAVDAKKEEDPDFVIGARTDAIAVAGIDEAIERANAYHKAGADFIFIEAFENVEQMEKAVKEVKAPLMLNLIEGGRTPLVSVQEAEKLGFKMVIFPLTALYSAAKAMFETLTLLKQKGTAQVYLDMLMTFPEFAKIVEIQKFREMEDKYIPEKILEKMYGKGPRKIV
ncbi:MAG: carboxyvinyl-carboxyphosphonate phosphorylmutase [Zestosphaera tikiterensis]|uniref:Carboxyvinyl-carboxyphosphonate phosphorylmutase n=1 Tax=Zestosphaera tikiterensis TaxID=1973259 RepID=A0A2R7Y7D8_9CREN|nr:MAG: carboxyvinyl-carboxyphosphonate phosphorylmutase [Zestosphaera tikiterensis]